MNLVEVGSFALIHQHLSWPWIAFDASGTRVTFEETVRTNRRILNLLGPIAHRLFAMNHRIAARKGAQGMRAYLARQTAGTAAANPS